MKSVSINYLMFMDARDVVTKKYDIPTKEGAILRRIVIAKINNETFTVNDVLQLRDIGSPASNHSFLKKLIKRKLVESIPDENDHRIRNLYPTKLALELFAQLSKEFNKFCKK